MDFKKYLDLVAYPLPEKWMDDPEHKAALSEIWPETQARNLALIKQIYASAIMEAAEVADRYGDPAIRDAIEALLIDERE